MKTGHEITIYCVFQIAQVFCSLKQEHDSIALLNCALPITKTVSVIRKTTFKFVHLKINIDLGL